MCREWTWTPAAKDTLVEFAHDDESRAYEEWRRANPNWPGGPPPNMDFFCDDHIAAARALSHLTRRAAVAQLIAATAP